MAEDYSSLKEVRKLCPVSHQGNQWDSLKLKHVHPSLRELFPSNRSKQLFKGRENKILSLKRESAYLRPNNFRNCEWLETPIDRQTSTSEGAKGNPHVSIGKGHSGQGSTINAGERSHQKAHPVRGQFLSTIFVRPKKEVNKIRPIINPEATKPVPALHSLQNGGNEERHRSPEPRRFHDKNRPERCILAHPSPPRVEKITAFSMGETAVRNASSSLWSGSSPPNIHKTSESAFDSFEETHDSYNRISGRFSIDRQNKGRGPPGKGLCDFSIDKLSSDNQLGEICVTTYPKIKVSGDDHR